MHRSSPFIALSQGLLDLLAPIDCLGCGRGVHGSASPRAMAPSLCVACEFALPWWRRVDGCPRCGSEPDASLHAVGGADPSVSTFDACPGCLSQHSALHRCHTLLRYQGAIRSWLPAFKRPSGRHGPRVSVARAIHALSDELGDRLRDATTIDLIVSMPLHSRRRRQRGFNHADVLARRIARRAGIPWSGRALVRTRETMPQASLSGSERITNVRGAFRATKRLAADCRVGIVDDVLTTGNTLEAAAEALLAAGAFEVRGITLAATLPIRSDPRGRQGNAPRGR